MVPGKSELARSVTDRRGRSPRWERHVRRQWQSEEGPAARFGQGCWRCQCWCWMAHCRCSMHGRTRRSSCRPWPAAFRDVSLQSAQSSSPVPALTLCWCCRSVEASFGHRLDTVDWLAGKSRLVWSRLWCQGSASRMDRMCRQVPRTEGLRTLANPRCLSETRPGGVSPPAQSPLLRPWRCSVLPVLLVRSRTPLTSARRTWQMLDTVPGLPWDHTRTYVVRSNEIAVIDVRNYWSAELNSLPISTNFTCCVQFAKETTLTCMGQARQTRWKSGLGRRVNVRPRCHEFERCDQR